jgi:hypothetical protein
MTTAIEKLREVGSFLGPEIVVAAAKGADGPGSGLVLAELKDASGFRAYLEQQISTIPATNDAPAVRIVDDPATAAASSDHTMNVFIHGDLVGVSDSLPVLAGLATRADNPASSAFRNTAFYTRIAEQYGEGVGFLIAADLQTIISGSMKKSEGENAARQAKAFEQLGVDQLRYFIVEEKVANGKASPRAVLTFDGQRRGIASWLAAPGPMGALDFISPDANVVAAFAVENPAALVDDVFNFVATSDPQALDRLHQFEAEHGVDIRQDFAAPLGGEFAFAVDGPLLPSPSWKMIFEVNDPTRLQQAFQHAVDEINKQAASAGQPGLELTSEESDGRTYYTLRSLDKGAEVHYTFASGYLVAAPSQALVDRAIRYRESGYTIASSPRFRATLPEDGNTNFSAIVYNDFSGILANVPGNVPQMPPTLSYAYARDDRIEFATSADGSDLGLSPASLLGLPGGPGLAGILHGGLDHKE